MALSTEVAGRRTFMIGSASLRDVIKARMTTSILNYVTQSMLNDIPFKSAPLLNPPISNGMTDTMKKLEAALIGPGPVPQQAFAQVSLWVKIS